MFSPFLNPNIMIVIIIIIVIYRSIFTILLRSFLQVLLLERWFEYI